MSRSVRVYSVPEQKLRGVVGSRDVKVMELLGPGTEGDARAARSLIEGRPWSGRPEDSVHGFERICRVMGRELPNRGVSPIRAALLEQVDAVLRAIGFPFQMSELLYRGAPISFPPAVDYPNVGHVETSRVKVACRHLEDKGLECDDVAVDEVLVSIGEWLEVSSARGDMLVGFYY